MRARKVPLAPLLLGLLCAPPPRLANAAQQPVDCVVTPFVDGHFLRSAVDARLAPTLSWRLSPGCGAAPQTAFRVELQTPSGAPLWQGALLHSNQSDNVPLTCKDSHPTAPGAHECERPGWMDKCLNCGRSGPDLQPGASYAVRVAVTLAGVGELDWSAPAHFRTQIDMRSKPMAASGLLQHFPPMWAANKSAEFVMLRVSPAASFRPRNAV